MALNEILHGPRWTTTVHFQTLIENPTEKLEYTVNIME